MIKFLLLFLLIPTYCIGQISYTEEVIFKNQKDIFKSKKIKQIKITGTHTETTLVTLDENGSLSEVKSYCYRTNNLSQKSKYDSIGNKVYNVDYDYECNGTKRIETSYIYKDTLLLELKIKHKGSEIYDTSSKRVYDSLGRIVKYLSNTGLYDSFGYWEEYSYPNDSSQVKFRINRDSTIIDKEISILNQNGQVIIRSTFYDKKKTYEVAYYYNKAYQLIREVGYSYPSKELSKKKLFTYDTSGKILRKDYNYSNKETYEIYKYNNEGLLIETESKSSYGKSSKKYEYIY